MIIEVSRGIDHRWLYVQAVGFGRQGSVRSARVYHPGIEELCCAT